MNRTEIMYMEIGCFLCCFCGWVLNCSTLPTEYWNFSEVGDAVVTTVNYFSNLWMDCVSDTTGVSDCKYYPSMMALPVFLHVCRALTIVSVILGFWGAVLTLIGMKCTKIGGSELANARVMFAAALTYLASGFSGMVVYSWWGHKTRAQYVDQNYKPQKFEIGAAVFVGWGGSSLIIAGSAVMCYFSGKEGLRSSSNRSQTPTESYITATSRGGYLTAPTRTIYMKPASSRHTTVILPSRVQTSLENKRPIRPQRPQTEMHRTHNNRINRTSAPTNMDSYV
ncbi:claudin-10-like [Astyanax mexicanus]|uniref:Claudin 10 n=1 Tax=Astyanax mexicanus TaxID=7994 RepID=A0A8B9JGU4_ASTMX|nr:claudin-10-like [Astyanax mexicanus]